MSNEERIIKYVKAKIPDDKMSLDELLGTLTIMEKLFDSFPNFEWSRILDAICGKEEKSES